MKHQFIRVLTIMLALLLMMASCGQSTENLKENDSASESSTATQDALDLPIKADWPTDQAPAELPEYTAGTITATADYEGVLTIKVADTSTSDLDVYLKGLKSAGWIVVSDDTQAEAAFGLYTVTFALQGADDAVLQIDVYTTKAGSWPVDKIPPDVPEPMEGVLVGDVEVLSSVENMWYFSYTYDGIDEAAAEAYMNSLTEKGWSGGTSQMYKVFEWKGDRYEGTIEIYETVENRTTFTCNFYLSAAEPTVKATESQPAPEAPAEQPTTEVTEAQPAPEAPEVPAKQPAGTDASVVGAWTLGMLSGGQFSADTGKYEGGASGMGQIYTFKKDGTYTALVVFGDTIWLSGKYSVNGDVLTLTGRTAEESSDGGMTWSAPEVLPDAAAPFAAGTDETGAYLLLGEEGATPPLIEKQNAMKYRAN